MSEQSASQEAPEPRRGPDSWRRGHEVFGDVGAPTGAPTLGVMMPIFGTLDGRIEPNRIGELAVYAEDHGLDGVWFGDHLVHPLPLLESIVSMEHVATLTRRVRIGTSVMLVALRPVVSAAKQLATISSYHPGRLTLGVGVGGEHPTEFRASGIPMDERGARLDEAVVHLRELWSGEPVTTTGRFSDLEGVRIAPVPPPIPLLFGGHTPRALRRAALLGDAWVGFYRDVEGFAAAAATIRQERELAGLGDVPFPVGMVIPTVVAEHGAAQRAADLMRGASTKDFQSSTDRFVIAGTPERAIERLAEYHAAGCDHFILAVLDQGDAYADQLATICADVLPALRAFS